MFVGQGRFPALSGGFGFFDIVIQRFGIGFSLVAKGIKATIFLLQIFVGRR